MRLSQASKFALLGQNAPLLGRAGRFASCAPRHATMAHMHRLLPLTLLILLVACTEQATVVPSPLPLPTLPLVAEVLAAPTPGQRTVVGILLVTPEGSVLADQIQLGAAEPLPLNGQALWLGVTPALPRASPSAPDGLIVEASGKLVGPGAYGPDGRYRYALEQTTLVPRTVRDLSIALLLANSALYEGQPVRVQGELLTSPDSALLVEQLGSGGVPAAGALQVKLAAPPRDPALAAGLHTSVNGRTSFGPIELMGFWRGGKLFPLSATLR